MRLYFFQPIYQALIDSRTPRLLFTQHMKAVHERHAIYYKLSKKCLALRNFSLWLHLPKNVPNHYSDHFPFTLRPKFAGGSKSKMLDLIQRVILHFLKLYPILILYVLVMFQSKLVQNQESPLKNLFQPVTNEPIDIFQDSMEGALGRLVFWQIS